MSGVPGVEFIHQGRRERRFLPVGWRSVLSGSHVTGLCCTVMA